MQKTSIVLKKLINFNKSEQYVANETLLRPKFQFKDPNVYYILQ